jgi:hypothetical protein
VIATVLPAGTRISASRLHQQIALLGMNVNAALIWHNGVARASRRNRLCGKATRLNRKSACCPNGRSLRQQIRRLCVKLDMTLPQYGQRTSLSVRLATWSECVSCHITPPGTPGAATGLSFPSYLGRCDEARFGPFTMFANLCLSLIRLKKNVFWVALIVFPELGQGALYRFGCVWPWVSSQREQRRSYYENLSRTLFGNR